MSEQGPGLGSGSGFRLSISHQGSQNRHSRDRDVASIGLSGGTLSQFSLTVSLSQYRLGSLTRDTIPLTADFVTLSHYLGTLPPRRLEVKSKSKSSVTAQRSHLFVAPSHTLGLISTLPRSGMLPSGTGGQSGTRLPTRETWPFVALLYEDVSKKVR